MLSRNNTDEYVFTMMMEITHGTENFLRASRIIYITYGKIVFFVFLSPLFPPLVFLFVPYHMYVISPFLSSFLPHF